MRTHQKRDTIATKVYNQVVRKLYLMSSFLPIFIKNQIKALIIRLKMICMKVKPATITMVVGIGIFIIFASLNDGLASHLSKYVTTLGLVSTSFFQKC